MAPFWVVVIFLLANKEVTKGKKDSEPPIKLVLGGLIGRRNKGGDLLSVTLKCDMFWESASPDQTRPNHNCSKTKTFLFLN